MRVTRRQFALLCAPVIFIAALAGLMQQHALLKLRNDNLGLQERICQSEEMQRLVQNPRPDAHSTISNPPDELKRLRAEVNEQQSEMQKLQAEISAERPEPLPPTLPFSMLCVKIPKDSWTFAGYATPKDALESMLWATREGNVPALRASLTPEEIQRRGWSALTDEEIAAQGIQGLANASGFEILKTEALGQGDAHLTVYIDGFDQSDQPLWMDFQQIGNEWKSSSSEHHRNWNSSASNYGSESTTR